MNTKLLYFNLMPINEKLRNRTQFREHSDGTSVMDIIHGTPSSSQFGGTTTISYSYPSMSNKLTKLCSKQNMGDGRLWTIKP